MQEEDSLEILEARNFNYDKKQNKNEAVEDNFKECTNKNTHQRIQSGSSHPKKKSHNRSHSCPFIAPLQASISVSNRA